MNCPKCQAPLPSDAAFCPNCGARPQAAAPAPPSGGGVRTLSGLSTIAPMRERQTSALEPGTVFAERYEVVRKLGEGGMGVVYVAKDTHTGEEMVLKLIHPDLVTGDDAIKRLMAEGLTARQIRHPNIVAVYDVSQWGGQPYFTMEFVRGGTLRSWMVRHISGASEVKVETAAGLIRTMLAGLAEAHRMGVVHRDLKPENVLLVGEPDDGNFDLKILDFGIAKAINAPRSSSGSGGAIGTPLYMAPEQMTSADAVGPAADLYSLSVMFYELLMEASPQARWEPVSKSRPDVPKAIDALIEKGLSARPRSRFASAEAYLEELDKAMGQAKPRPTPDPRPTPPPQPPPQPPPPRPEGPGFFGSMSKRTKMWVGIGAAVVVLGIIGLLDETIIENGGGGGVVDGGGDGNDGGGGGGGGRGGGEIVEQTTQAENYSGSWRDGLGNLFAVRHTGNSFSGSGNVPGTGTVHLNGTISGSRATITISTPFGGTFFQGSGRIVMGAGGMDFDFGSHLFHVNH